MKGVGGMVLGVLALLTAWGLGFLVGWCAAWLAIAVAAEKSAAERRAGLE